ncbi:MAG: helix-turn-helix transcriptional regulator [Micropruina sp.]|uniref:helix-turn-helix domain-containing protein n=1 Tax=Micropruina sp. TaxID=2737536 RepID=UPI0039E38C28
MPTPSDLSPRIQQWRTDFGLHLRRHREQRRLSQEALAESAGVDRKLIYRTELGQTSPRLDAVVKLADALGLDPAELLPRSD